MLPGPSEPCGPQGFCSPPVIGTHLNTALESSWEKLLLICRSVGEINLLQREMRRRVWWGAYLMDAGAAITFGRPILLPGLESMDVKPVLDISDEASVSKPNILSQLTYPLLTNRPLPQGQPWCLRNLAPRPSTQA